MAGPATGTHGYTMKKGAYVDKLQIPNNRSDRQRKMLIVASATMVSGAIRLRGVRVGGDSREYRWGISMSSPFLLIDPLQKIKELPDWAGDYRENP